VDVSAARTEASNWNVYAKQLNLRRVPVTRLVKLVLPCRRNTVLVFDRITDKSQATGASLPALDS
jgi:hypothetical protein